MLTQQNAWYWARTMRTEDVLDGYISALEDFQHEPTIQLAPVDIDRMLSELRFQRDALENEDRDYEDMEHTSFLLEEAFDAINQALPEDYYWGVDGNDPSYGGLMWHYECLTCLEGIETEHEYRTD